MSTPTQNTANVWLNERSTRLTSLVALNVLALLAALGLITWLVVQATLRAQQYQWSSQSAERQVGLAVLGFHLLIGVLIWLSELHEHALASDTDFMTGGIFNSADWMFRFVINGSPDSPLKASVAACSAVESSVTCACR